MMRAIFLKRARYFDRCCKFSSANWVLMLSFMLARYVVDFMGKWCDLE